MELFNYDDSDIESIYKYAQKVVGVEFIDILKAFQESPYKTYQDYINQTPSTTPDKKISSASKGQYGTYIEKYYFGIPTNSSTEPDFNKVGVELKVTPFKVNKDEKISAKERLVLGNINYMNENLDDFYKSHAWKKGGAILLLPYHFIKNQDILKNKITKVHLLKILEEDLPTIINDYQKIAQKIKEGRAHELSERDGMYLSTSRKGAGKGRDLTPQPFSDAPANKRAWSFKQSYITRLYQETIFTSEELESIARATKDTSKPFTQILEEKILQYRGKSEKELCKEFDVKFKSKGRNNSIVTKMMQLLDLPQEIENTTEFKKANMMIRAIRVKRNNSIKEDVSFKSYSFIELANEDNEEWEDSHVYTEIFSKKILFVIFRENESGDFCLDQVKFWGFPESLEPELMRVWQETKDIINRGVELTPRPNGKNRVKVSTNFPQSRKNKILYTKVHAHDSYYEIEPGKFIGKGKLKDTDELPDGRHITKHSFWLPKRFVREILEGQWD